MADPKGLVRVGVGEEAHEQFSLIPRNMTEAMEFSKLIAGTSLVPKSYRDKDGKVNPGDILIAVAMGNEVGLKPLQAIQNIAVINGQPTIWGDAMKALCEASGQLEYCVETWDEKTKTATCKVKRKGKPERVETFSMADAVAADLAKKDTYVKYPKRMCGARCRSWGLRGEFSDILKGLQCREEVEDYEAVGETTEGVTIMRPRRKSEAAAASSTATQDVAAPAAAPSVDSFQSEVGTSKVGAPAPVDRSKLVKVLIEDVQQKTGNGKTFYVLSFKTSSGAGSASTFEGAHFEAAQKLKGEFALIGLKESAKKDKDGKPYINLIHVEAAPEEDETATSDAGSEAKG